MATSRAKPASATYHYGSNANCAVGSNAGPHAVCKAGTNAYTYDLNGNLTGGGGRSVAWTSWNMPASITEGGNTTNWLYGPERDRYKLTATGRTTWYLNPSVHQGGHYEQHAVRQRHRRTPPHALRRRQTHRRSPHIHREGTAPAAQTRYFHSDIQGSITAVTDQNGQVITRYRYDPWGKQTLVSGSNTGIDATRQGHTGHEMLDGGLTHMNGRLYDPVLGRFVSADPIVQAPYDLQSLNRYSYVMNNPLYYTDPTGFSAWTDFRDGFLKPVVGIAAGFMFGPGGAWALTGNAFANSVIAGAISGGITGGRQGALQGGLTGGLFYGAGQFGNSLSKAGYAGFANDGFGRALLHAGAGCISASAGGGSCGTGAMTAGFTKFASSNINVGNDDFAKLVKYAVIGGTASVIGGGKFANGAQTGAFQYLVNEAVSAGVSLKAPRWLGKIVFGKDYIGQGGSVGVAVSYPGRLGGDYDLGIYSQAAGGGEDYGTGRYTIDLAVQSGGVRDLNGQGAELSFNDGIGGMKVTTDSKGNLNGVGVHVGPGYNIGGAGTVTKALTVRDAVDWAVKKVTQ